MSRLGAGSEAWVACVDGCQMLTRGRPSLKKIEGERWHAVITGSGHGRDQGPGDRDR